MSAEFEKIVLEKLDRIETKLEAHDKKFEEHDRRFDEQDKRFDEHDRRFDEQDNRFAQLEKIVIENNKKIDAMMDTLKVHQNLLTLFEYDFNQKMQAVLDGIVAINERNAKYDDMFMHFSSKILNHETRISILEEEQEKYNKE